MARRPLLQEKILSTEEKPLSPADLDQLTGSRNKQFIRLISWYIPLAAILLYVIIDGISVIEREKFPFPKYELSDEEQQRFQAVVPYVCGFFFLMLTGFFINYYLPPLIKDIKKRKKLLLRYIPEKSAMSVFNRYYLSTPVFQKQQVQISSEDFHSIPDGGTITVDIAPYSYTVLSFSNTDRQIKVF